MVPRQINSQSNPAYRPIKPNPSHTSGAGPFDNNMTSNLPADTGDSTKQETSITLSEDQNKGLVPPVQSPLPNAYFDKQLFFGHRMLHIRPIGESCHTSTVLEDGDSPHWKVLKINQLWGKLKFKSSEEVVK